MLPSKYSQIAKIAAPIIGTSVANIFANIIGMLFVARLGHEQLAAGALVSSTYIALLVFATGSLFSVSILIAGTARDNIAAIRETFHSGLLFGLILGIILMPIFYFSNYIFIWFNQPMALIDITHGYFRIMMYAIPLIIVYMVLQQFFIGIEKPGVNLKITLMSMISTTIFAYIFILGKLGFPVYGLAGLAIAQLLSLFLLCAIYIWYLYKLGFQQKYQLYSSPIALSRTKINKLVKLGLPIGVQYCAELAGTAVATYFIGWLGVTSLAAVQISSQISLVAVMIFLGISQSASVMVSQSVSKNDFAAAIEYNRAANIQGFVLMLVVLAAFVSFPNFFIHFYINPNLAVNEPVVHLAKVLFIVAGIGLIFDGFRNITAGSLRGIHDSQTAMLWGIACQWLIGLPLGYILGFHFAYGAAGVRFGGVIGFMICAIILMFRFRYKMLKK